MYPIQDRRPCDQCTFMADTFHSDMCLHPSRRDPGPLGDAIDNAINWNADCPVQHVGRPVFHILMDLNLPVEEWEVAGEYLRARIAKHLQQHGSITAEAINDYAASYVEALAIAA